MVLVLVGLSIHSPVMYADADEFEAPVVESGVVLYINRLLHHYWLGK